MNRWEEHLELIEAGKAQINKTCHAYWPNKWRKILATIKQAPKEAGLSLSFPEEVTIREDDRILLVPAKGGSAVKVTSLELIRLVKRK